MSHGLPPKSIAHSIIDFETKFRDEDDCRSFLEKMRWPQGFRCNCGGKGWQTARGLWKCKICNTLHSVTAGTMFHGSHLPLMLWFRAIWWMTNHRTGTSALGLQNVLGIGSYHTAWSMLHAIRKTMSQRRRPLKGQLGVGICNFSIGRTANSKVAIIIEEHATGVGRIRLRPIHQSPTELIQFVREVVSPGCRIAVDNALTQELLLNYTSQQVITISKKTAARIKIPIALVRRWLNGTHQGRCEAKYLRDYLEEFSFRFNRRHVQHIDALFLHVMEAAVFDWAKVKESKQ